jgi:hypothetical protein
MDDMFTIEAKVFWGAFFGAFFAFLFNIFLNYIRNRNKLKFYLLKTDYLLTAHANLLNSYRDGYADFQQLCKIKNEDISEIVSKNTYEKMKSVKDKIFYFWFNLSRKGDPFELIKFPLEEIFPLLKNYKSTLDKILTADFGIQAFNKLQMIRNNLFNIYLEQTQILKDEEIRPEKILECIGGKKYHELADITYQALEKYYIAFDELQKAKSMLANTRKIHDNWIKHILHIACLKLCNNVNIIDSNKI